VLSGCGVVVLGVLGLELNGRDKADLAVKAAVIEPVPVQPQRPGWAGGPRQSSWNLHRRTWHAG